MRDMVAEFQPPDLSLWAILPFAIVAITAMFVLLDGVFGGDDRPHRTVSGSLLGLALAAVATVLTVLFRADDAFGRMLLVDRAAALFYLMLLGGTAITVLLSADHLRETGAELSEAVAMLLISCVGMMLMASTGNLVMVFVGLETMSISLYILAGIAGGRDPASNEAALKYLLLGAFATGFLIYGMAFVYGATGALDLAEIGAKVASGAHLPGFLNLGLGLLTIGLGFKVALVPFHMWAPDVYEGAPTPVTAFMSVGVKVAAFAAMIRIFDLALLPVAEIWQPVLFWLAVATMFFGNVIALAQTSLKRLLAYSSIAHAGYLLVGVTAGSLLGVQGVIFYGLSYTLMNLGAFVVLAAITNGREQRPQLSDLQGLARRSPRLAGAMALFMFALAGIPPLSGFVGKWLLFAAAVEAQQVPLAVLAVLCSAISAFYYLRVVVYMYMSEPVAEAEALTLAPRTRQALWACVIGTVLLSFPTGLLFVGLSSWGAQSLFP